jgi:hypothetical protein
MADFRLFIFEKSPKINDFFPFRKMICVRKYSYFMGKIVSQEIKPKSSPKSKMASLIKKKSCKISTGTSPSRLLRNNFLTQIY